MKTPSVQVLPHYYFCVIISVINTILTLFTHAHTTKRYLSHEKHFKRWRALRLASSTVHIHTAVTKNHPRNILIARKHNLKSNMFYQDVKTEEKMRPQTCEIGDEPQKEQEESREELRREMYYVDPPQGGKPWINKSVNFTQLTSKINKKGY